MKNFFLGLCACALILVSCQKEQNITASVDGDNCKTVAIHAGFGASTKTSVEHDGANNQFIPHWTIGDKLSVFTAVGGTMSDVNQLFEIAEGGISQDRTATFTGSLNTTPGEKDLYAYYPYGTCDDFSKCPITLPALQRPSVTSFDGSADILWAEPNKVIIGDNGSVSDVLLTFKRKTAMVALNLSFADNAIAKITKVELIVPDTYRISGKKNLNLSDGTFSDGTAADTDHTVVAEYPEGVPASTMVLMNVYPVKFAANDKITVKVTGSGKEASRTLTLSEAKAFNEASAAMLEISYTGDEIHSSESGTISVEDGEIGWENGSVGGVTDVDFMVSVSGEVSGKPGYSIVGVDALGFITGGSVVVTYTEEGTGGLDVKGICNVERKVDGTTHTYTITGLGSDIEVSYMESYITVGDYFYSDGTAGSAESKENCTTLGCVYRLGAHDTDDPSVYGMDKINGYVVCTVPVDGTYSWLTKVDDPAYKGILANLEGLAEGDCNNVEKYLGYPLTNAIRAALDNYATIETDFPFWHKFATLAAAPKNTSGWYIPSVAQLADIDNSNVVPDFEGQYYSSNVYAELSGTEVLRMWAIEYNTADKKPKNDWASDARKMIVMLTF